MFKPKVAIIIPCKNEVMYISKCLSSVILSDYPEKLKSIFVCDGLSNDGTLRIINDFITKYPFIKLLENKMETTPYALNLGIQNSDADIFIILGAHSEISTDYIIRCVEAFEFDYDIGCVGGIIENVYENEVSEIIGKSMSSMFGVGNAYFRTGGKNGFVDTVAFGAYKRKVFDKAGYFDTDLTRNQDDEFNYRIIKAGYKIYLSNNIHSKYYVRGSYSKLFNQYFQYGYWKVCVNLKHKTITTVRQLAPFLLVCYIIIGLFISFISLKLLRIYLLGIVLYLVLVIAFSIFTSRKLKHILGVAYAFLILHISYGFGYLTALINTFIFKKKIRKKFDSLTR